MPSGDADSGRSAADEAVVRSIADDLPVAIWLGTVPKGDVVYVNKAFQEILGFDPPEGADRDNWVSEYGIYTREGEPFPPERMPFEVCLRARATVIVDDLVIHRGTRRVYLRVVAKPLFDAQGNITHVLEAFHDINREVAAEKARADGETRLRQAQRLEAIGNLAGGIAHDFNNMLAAVKILTTHLARSEPDAHRLELLRDIEQVVDSAGRLTHALLRFARRGDAAIQPVAIDDLVEQVTHLASRTIDRKIGISADCAGRSIVLGDPAQIEQVLMNLVVNARDAMPDGGRLTLRTRPLQLDAPRGGLAPGRYVEIDVADTGHGIDKALRERVFEPYFTTKTTGPVKGTGLGLATVYGIVRAHAGSIEVADTEGGGTTMRVLFPCTDDRAAGAAEGRRVAALRREGTLLVVDDEGPVLRAATIALEGMGYVVIAAPSGTEAIERFRASHERIDAVVLDMVMPDMDGRQTYRALSEIDPHVPVVVTSGLALTDEAQATLDLGARAFTAKPFDPHVLSELIERVRRSR